MAACTVVRDRAGTELPKKIELGSAPIAFSDPRLQAWSTLDEPDMSCGRPHSGSIGLPQGAPGADAEQSRLRLRTESNLGMLASPYLPVLEPTQEAPYDIYSQWVDPRNRFRTESIVGMPVSPWTTFEGMGVQNFGGPCADVAVRQIDENHSTPSAPVRPFMYPGTCDQADSPVQQLQLSALLGSAPLVETAAAAPLAASSRDKPRTTVMLRNLPSSFTGKMLLDFLDSQGFSGRYDFAYQPVKFETLTCLSHAFVNMVSPADAECLWEQLDGFSEWKVPCDNACSVVWNDKHQGLDALVERYRNSPVMHPDIPEECKPILLSAGRRIPFPPPTQRIKSPKICIKRNA